MCFTSGLGCMKMITQQRRHRTKYLSHTHSRCSLHIVFTICQPIVYSNINLNNMS